MKLNKTVIKKNFDDLSGKVNLVFEEGIKALDTLLSISKVCVTEYEYSNLYGKVEDNYSYFQLDEMDMINDLTDLENLKLFSESLSCKDYVLCRRLRDFLQYFNLTKELIENAEDVYIPLTKQEVDLIKRNLDYAIGNLSICFYYQFDMDTTASCIGDNRELEVDINVYQYAEANNMSVSDLVLKVKESWSEHRPSLPLFEEYPELEDQFYDIAGAFVQDFDLLESSITVDDIYRIINDSETDIEALVKEIESRATGETEKLSQF